MEARAIKRLKAILWEHFMKPSMLSCAPRPEDFTCTRSTGAGKPAVGSVGSLTPKLYPLLSPKPKTPNDTFPHLSRACQARNPSILVAGSGKKGWLESTTMSDKTSVWDSERLSA